MIGLVFRFRSSAAAQKGLFCRLEPDKQSGRGTKTSKKGTGPWKYIRGPLIAVRASPLHGIC